MSKKLYAVLLITFFFSAMHFVTQHELAHKRIYAGYGCDSIIQFDQYLYMAMTIPEADCKYNAEMTKLHLQNEITGYHMYPVFISIWLMFIIFILSRRD